MKSALITAGSTMVPIDNVRAITNIFNGRTGTNIALYFARQGWTVRLLTSNPSLLQGKTVERLSTEPFHTYHDLFCAMKRHVCSHENYDAVIHSAAVSDYRVDGTYLLEPEGAMRKVSPNGKIASSYKELYLRLVPTQKIVDLIREPWGYQGYLVKFKLQTMMSDEQLLKVAEESRTHSKAQMMVANCLEWSNERAYVMTEGRAVTAARANLPETIMQEMGL
jgi:phosphopantothenate-cysteine ligase/phosphopantothenoylcysteine decarboxylase/phosphopantothenate--cysteine ligase